MISKGKRKGHTEKSHHDSRSSSNDDIYNKKLKNEEKGHSPLKINKLELKIGSSASPVCIVNPPYNFSLLLIYSSGLETKFSSFKRKQNSWFNSSWTDFK